MWVSPVRLQRWGRLAGSLGSPLGSLSACWSGPADAPAPAALRRRLPRSPSHTLPQRPHPRPSQPRTLHPHCPDTVPRPARLWRAGLTEEQQGLGGPAGPPQAQVHHAVAVVRGQHAEALHSLRWVGGGGGGAHSRLTPPASPGQGGRGSEGSGMAWGPSCPLHSPGQRGPWGIVPSWESCPGSPGPGTHGPPTPRPPLGPGPYARVFLNTAFFRSFLRMTVCDWHPCTLGGGPRGAVNSPPGGGGGGPLASHHSHRPARHHPLLSPPTSTLGVPGVGAPASLTSRLLSI